MKTSEKAIANILDEYHASAYKHAELLQSAKDEKANLRKSAPQYERRLAEDRIDNISEALKDIHEYISQLQDLLYGVDEYDEICAQINKLVERRNQLLPSRQMRVKYSSTMREINKSAGV